MRLLALLCLPTALALGCGDDPAGGAAARGDLPTLHPSDPDRAEAGRRFLFEAWPGAPVLPEAAIYNLSYAWEPDQQNLIGDAYWEEFERRYGFFRTPGQELPLGFHPAGSAQVTLSCLACHVDEGPDGELWVGAANRRLDLRRLAEDGQKVADLFGVEVPTIDTEGLQLAPGAIDAIGLGFQLAADRGIDGLNLHFGFQQAPSWWNQRVKEKNFTDGGSHVTNHRTTMATLVAFGWTEVEAAEYEDDFLDVQQYLWSLEAPAWSLAPPDGEAAARGEVVFDARCASCHGTYHGETAGFPDRVATLAEVGTDPLRTENFTDAEAAALNASWFAEVSPFEATGGYLAPALLGVWASAPYFHDGSVPDLAGVLDSSDRPAIWRLVDPPAYDAARVGWAWEATTADAPRAYDTSIPGLGNGGHGFGDDLSEAERADVLEYLKTL